MKKLLAASIGLWALNQPKANSFYSQNKEVWQNTGGKRKKPKIK